MPSFADQKPHGSRWLPRRWKICTVWNKAAHIKSFWTFWSVIANSMLDPTGEIVIIVLKFENISKLTGAKKKIGAIQSSVNSCMNSLSVCNGGDMKEIFIHINPVFYFYMWRNQLSCSDTAKSDVQVLHVTFWSFCPKHSVWSGVSLISLLCQEVNQCLSVAKYSLASSTCIPSIP